ncbi:hypothetical protein AMELA_G00274790 [Ameiurus melas]|uniref:Uncharacterized protein n=1 Tax=Ameiurus melas TaxID=219545 RepID=A0A7J5ZM72_AMEME|nr:hypothetical protein AMELA_G00274790 [Ameiurus melas]
MFHSNFDSRSRGVSNLIILELRVAKTTLPIFPSSSWSEQGAALFKELFLFSCLHSHSLSCSHGTLLLS